MSKTLKPAKQAVELRPSRIRRDPVREVKKPAPRSREFEIWVGVTGIGLFALAIVMVTVGFSVITGSGSNSAAAKPVQTEFLRCGIGDGSNCVVDGDTIRIDDAAVQIAGIQAPRLRGAGCDQEAQRGSEAVENLLQILNSGKVTTGGSVRDIDGQVRTRVLVNGADVGVAMLDAGAARSIGTDPEWCAR